MKEESWSFVAMEYYAAILNRTFVITIDEEWLRGVKCRGLTSVSSGDALTGVMTNMLAVSGDLNDPDSYVDQRLLRKTGRANFAIRLSDICAVEYNPKKKWGMGYYPHDGRVYVTAGKRRREFIVLGAQSGRNICTRLSASVAQAKQPSKWTRKKPHTV